LERARREGNVRTLLGRIRYLPDIAAKNTAVRQFNERVAVNTPIQGTSADIIKVAMINIYRAMEAAPSKWGSRPVLQVHDELVFETPRKETAAFAKWVRHEMESAVKLKIPLVVDVKVGDNWQDMEKLK
jgi:DNA polymerase-1